MNIEKCYIGMAMETEGGFFSPTLNIKMASMNEIFSKCYSGRVGSLIIFLSKQSEPQG